MTSAMDQDIDAVLAHVDQSLDGSLARLFELIRIPSVSTDPAYRDHCRTAAEWLSRDLAAIGFEASVRKTTGHPMVVAHEEGGIRTASAVLRPLRCPAGRSAGTVDERSVRAAHGSLAEWRYARSSRAARPTTRDN